MHIAPTDPQSLHDQFLVAVQRESLRTLGAVVAWAHVQAPVVGHDLFGEVGYERCGLLRWMKIDEDLRLLIGKLPGVDIEWKKNPAGGGKHIEISAGLFKLLLAHDGDPETLVPKSDYAKSLTRSNQMTMFGSGDELEALPPAAENRFYAVLFHSKAVTKGQTPGILEVRFPDGRNGYAADHLKLLTLFPELIDEAWLSQASVGRSAPAAAKEEKIKEEALPKLRKQPQVGT
jgi:hypothetical protein